jgi:hypothetical protein
MEYIGLLQRYSYSEKLPEGGQVGPKHVTTDVILMSF